MTQTTSRQFKDLIYAQLARVGKALSAPKRLELLDLLGQGPKTVEVLAREAAISVANASQHLQLLRSARLVEGFKRGLFVEYRVADPQISQFYVALREVGEARLAEVEQVTRTYLESRNLLEEVPGEELLRRVRAGEVTVLDVRPAEEYTAGHIPGAVSVPLSELPKRIGQIPVGREVVAYCRGPYCVMAIDAVAILKKKGIRAHRLEEGVQDWRARGWRVEVGA